MSPSSRVAAGQPRGRKPDKASRLGSPGSRKGTSWGCDCRTCLHHFNRSPTPYFTFASSGGNRPFLPSRRWPVNLLPTPGRVLSLSKLTARPRCRRWVITTFSLALDKRSVEWRSRVQLTAAREVCNGYVTGFLRRSSRPKPRSLYTWEERGALINNDLQRYLRLRTRCILFVHIPTPTHALSGYLSCASATTNSLDHAMSIDRWTEMHYSSSSDFPPSLCLLANWPFQRLFACSAFTLGNTKSKTSENQLAAWPSIPSLMFCYTVSALVSWGDGPVRLTSGSSSQSDMLSKGKIIVFAPARRAATVFSRKPPMRRTLPVTVSSPVIAMLGSNGLSSASDSSEVAIVIPAEGPIPLELGWPIYRGYLLTVFLNSTLRTV